MYNVRNVTEDIYWVGANDNRLSLFENIHPLVNGVSYNSYLLTDKKTVLFDTVDWAVFRQFLENIKNVIGDKPIDYLVVNHMEPDHAACIQEIIIRYPDIKIICTNKASLLMHQFGFNIDGRITEVKDGDKMSFGKHEFMFIAAPMVHWPEVMVSYDMTSKILFSADAFGTFGSLEGKVFIDEYDIKAEWEEEARRYYANIVGKYGPHVQSLLKKAKGIEIKTICPLHGPIWNKDLGYLIGLYDKWSRYEAEEKGVVIAYGSMYGNTESAAFALANVLTEKGVKNVKVYDVSSTHVSYLISDIFKYSNLVLACVTYNLNIFLPMKELLMDMKALNVQNRNISLIENGSWAPQAGRLMREHLETMRNINILDTEISIVSNLRDEKMEELEAMADNIIESMK